MKWEKKYSMGRSPKINVKIVCSAPCMDNVTLASNKPSVNYDEKNVHMKNREKICQKFTANVQRTSEHLKWDREKPVDIDAKIGFALPRWPLLISNKSCDFFQLHPCQHEHSSKWDKTCQSTSQPIHILLLLLPMLLHSIIIFATKRARGEESTTFDSSVRLKKFICENFKW